MIIHQGVQNHPAIRHTVSPPQSGAETGLFSHQGPVVNTKMEPVCPPRELSPRFAAKITNRANFRALYFPFNGVLEKMFLSRPNECLAPDRVSRCHYGPESRVVAFRKMMKNCGRPGFYMADTDFGELLILLPHRLERWGKNPGIFPRSRRNPIPVIILPRTGIQHDRLPWF